MSNRLTVGNVEVGGRAWIAPMTGVSDLPFRKAASKLGAAYVATEMVACAEFARGRADVVRRAAVGEGLPLMVVQLVGRDPAHIASGAKLAAGVGSDGRNSGARTHHDRSPFALDTRLLPAMKHRQESFSQRQPTTSHSKWRDGLTKPLQHGFLVRKRFPAS